MHAQWHSGPKMGRAAAGCPRTGQRGAQHAHDAAHAAGREEEAQVRHGHLRA
jgi:hypothetical protein